MQILNSFKFRRIYHCNGVSDNRFILKYEPQQAVVQNQGATSSIKRRCNVTNETRHIKPYKKTLDVIVEKRLPFKKRNSEILTHKECNKLKK
jgi:hypothetical protein